VTAPEIGSGATNTLFVRDLDEVRARLKRAPKFAVGEIWL
jgi:hypothetical protein